MGYLLAGYMVSNGFHRDSRNGLWNYPPVWLFKLRIFTQDGVFYMKKGQKLSKI